MATCYQCGQDMVNVTSCKRETIKFFIDGVVVVKSPVPYNGEGRCWDCGVKTGEYHHPGCDMEQCPFCGGQFISCDCRVLASQEA